MAKLAKKAQKTKAVKKITPEDDFLRRVRRKRNSGGFSLAKRGYMAMAVKLQQANKVRVLPTFLEDGGIDERAFPVGEGK